MIAATAMRCANGCCHCAQFKHNAVLEHAPWQQHSQQNMPTAHFQDQKLPFSIRSIPQTGTVKQATSLSLTAPFRGCTGFAEKCACHVQRADLIPEAVSYFLFGLNDQLLGITGCELSRTLSCKVNEIWTNTVRIHRNWKHLTRQRLEHVRLNIPL